MFPLLNISGVWQTEAESNKARSCLSEEGGGRRTGDRRGNNPYLLLDKESGTLQNSHIGNILVSQSHNNYNYCNAQPEGDDNDEDIVIRLDSKDPHKCKNITRFNYIKMDFIPVKLRFVNY